MRLRSHLIALVCPALVPVLGFAAFVSRENARLQLSATERGMRETARAVARTVDEELETAITTLEALGEAEPLDAGSLASFHELCRRVVRSQGRGDRYLPIAQADGIVSCMAVPIVTAGTVVGVIYANNFARRPFTAEDEALLVTLAHHAAVAVLGIPNAPQETARRAREIIARQNTHLAHLVDDLLDVARVTSGKIALERRPLELAQAVRQSIATLAASGRTEHHRVTVALDPVWANVDETRFEQIVGNLVGNALRLTPAGGQIEIALRAADGLAVLRVRDSGIGIAPEMLRIVLELAGHEVHEAVDGPSGLAAALGLRPDIALLDIGLPGFDGLEIARRVRLATGASMYLVALTGYGQPDDRRVALEAGFDAHLVKPVDPPTLLAAIRAVFSAAREA